MSRENLIRILCTTLVSVVLALSLILVVAVCGSGMLASEPVPEDAQDGFRPSMPDEPIDPEDILSSLDMGDLTREPDWDTDPSETSDSQWEVTGGVDETLPIEPSTDPLDSLPVWESGMEWPTLPPSLDTDADVEWPTLPEDWDTLPADWDTLPEDWGDVEIPDGSSLADLLAGMNGDLGMPDGALAAGVASQLTVMEIYAEVNDTLYLKMQSFGSYTGQSWTEAEAYDRLLSGLYAADYLPGLSMDSVQTTPTYFLKITPVMPVRVIPYYIYTGGSSSVQQSDVVATGSTEGTYSMYYRPYGAVSVDHIHSTVEAYEALYRSHAYETYLEIDATTKAYLQQIIDEQGFDINDEDVVEKVAAYVRSAAVYDLQYDKNLDSEPNVAMAFLGAYKAGVCRHFASAATLLYRALGIPARYVVGFCADVTAGETTAVKGAQAHAWVEVYEPDFGWRCVEVTGTASSGGTPGGDTEETTAPDGETTEPNEDKIPTTWGDLLAGTHGMLGLNESSLPAGIANSLTVFQVVSDKTDRVLLKMRSFGDYTGMGWSQATAYTELLSDTYSADYLAGIAMESAAQDGVTFLQIQSPVGSYAIPYYISMRMGNYDIQTDDTKILGNTDGAYSLYCTAYRDCTQTTRTAKLYEKAYRLFVYSHYTAVRAETATYLEAVIRAEGFDANDPDIIEKVADYLRRTAVYNTDYDRSLDSESDVVIAFLDTYGEGVSRHFASAATLLYRALGIPARYTVGYYADTVAGETVTVKGSAAYAWVEVYVDGLGWRYVDVAGLPEEHTGTKPVITVTPVSQRKQYDGRTLYASSDVIVEGFEAWAALGYTYSTVVIGEQTEVGRSVSTVSLFRIYNEKAELVTDQFVIQTQTGELWVYLCEISCSSDSLTKVYDGSPLTLTEAQCRLDGGKLPDGYVCLCLPTGICTEVGTTVASFTVQIISLLRPDQDVSELFLIHKTYGSLTVTPATLTLKAGDAEKTYDGSPLTANTLEITGGALAKGDFIASYTVEGSQTRVGRADNVITDVVIRNANGEDVTGNYAIETQTGTLRVTAS